MMNLFVCRIAKGHDGGLLTGPCPVNFKEEFETHISKDLRNAKLGQIPYKTNNYLDYLHNELWQSGKLRQGWGCEGFSLEGILDDENESSRENWIKSYILALKKFWNTDPLDPVNGYTKDYTPCDEASGRMYMLANVMLMAKPHDIVFIPKHSNENHHDDLQFTVCEIIGKYYFDLNPNYFDFGHTLVVRNLKTYKYGEYGIDGVDFLGQHQKAVSTIKPYYEKYNLFKGFVDKHYLPHVKKYSKCDEGLLR